MAKGKRYHNARAQIDRASEYPLAEAIALSKRLATARFDETIELHLRLGIDPRHSDQQVRSTVMLPNGSGKTVRVLVFAEEGDDLRAAESGGAEYAGLDEFLQQIQGGWLEFEATIAVPSVMRKVGRVARILGPARADAVAESGHRRAIRRYRARRARAESGPRGIPQ